MSAQSLDQLLDRRHVRSRDLFGVRLEAPAVASEGGRLREIPEQPFLRAGVGCGVQRQCQAEPSEQLHQGHLACARQAELAQMPHDRRQGGGVVDRVVRSTGGYTEPVAEVLETRPAVDQ